MKWYSLEARKEYLIKRSEEREKLILEEEKALAQIDKDIIHLKQIELSIEPYSRWWRWGYLGSVRRARKALEKMKGR